MKTSHLANIVYLAGIITLLISCQGYRNIYSAVPFASPVPMKKGENSIEVSYSSNKSKSNNFDSTGNSDQGYGLHFAHMRSSKSLILGYLDIKNEKNTMLFHTKSRFDNSTIFDSSVIYTKRITAGVGYQWFSNLISNNIISFSSILGFQSMKLKETGLDTGLAFYSRYYNMTQILLTNQFSRVFRISKSFNLAYVSRLTFAYYFPSRTDYTAFEKTASALDKDGHIGAYICMVGLYADLKPIKRIPIAITGQWYNDWTAYEHLLGKNEFGLKHIKGSGGALGIKYIF